MENEGGFCLDCNHKHRGIAVCSYCDCNWTLRLEEDNMLKKLWKKFKDLIGLV